MKRILLSGWILFMVSLIAQAKVELPSLFSDNMVLQQNSSAAVWGKADPRTKIVITTTWSKAKTITIKE